MRHEEREADTLQRSRRSSRRRGSTSRSHCRSPTRCFNGAAVHHGGEEGPSPPTRTSARGFNGAAVHHGGEDVKVTVSDDPRTKLQRSRRSSRRRGARPRHRDRRARAASTEPPFITAERARRSTPSGSPTARFNGAAVHHGGEVQRYCDNGIAHGGFNGAAVHHGGEALPPTDVANLMPRFNGAAVHHGGEAGGGGRRGGGVGGFNGAAVHHGGEGWTAPTMRSASMTLQRSRRSSRRRGLLRALLLLGVRAASTEPPFITAERPTSEIFFSTSTRLQRSRRSSRRRGVSAIVAAPAAARLQRSRRSSRRRGRIFGCQSDACSSFNGAAVHHGGEDEPPSISPSAFVRLQRSRRSSRRRGPLTGASDALSTFASTEPPFITAERRTHRGPGRATR